MGVKTLSPAEILQGNSVGGSSRNSSLLSVGNPTYEKIRFVKSTPSPLSRLQKCLWVDYLKSFLSDTENMNFCGGFFPSSNI